MNNTELVSKFNLSSNIDYSDLGKRIENYLSDDSNPDRMEVTVRVIKTAIELDWELFQYDELLRSKKYSELYSIIISTYALNKKLGKIPTELTQLDIKLRRETDTDKVIDIVNSVFLPMILNLILKFNIDKSLMKIFDVILVTREVCIKYHKKVKLTLDENKFKRLKTMYAVEIAYFGFKGKFTENDLKSEYRRRVKITHPDLGGNPKEFMELKENYDKLMRIFE